MNLSYQLARGDSSRRGGGGSVYESESSRRGGGEPAFAGNWAQEYPAPGGRFVPPSPYGSGAGSYAPPSAYASGTGGFASAFGFRDGGRDPASFERDAVASPSYRGAPPAEDARRMQDERGAPPAGGGRPPVAARVPPGDASLMQAARFAPPPGDASRMPAARGAPPAKREEPPVAARGAPPAKREEPPVAAPVALSAKRGEPPVAARVAPPHGEASLMPAAVAEDSVPRHLAVIRALEQKIMNLKTDCDSHRRTIAQKDCDIQELHDKIRGLKNTIASHDSSSVDFMTKRLREVSDEKLKLEQENAQLKKAFLKVFGSMGPLMKLCSGDSPVPDDDYSFNSETAKVCLSAQNGRGTPSGLVSQQGIHGSGSSSEPATLFDSSCDEGVSDGVVQTPPALIGGPPAESAGALAVAASPVESKDAGALAVAASPVESKDAGAPLMAEASVEPADAGGRVDPFAGDVRFEQYSHEKLLQMIKTVEIPGLVHVIKTRISSHVDTVTVRLADDIVRVFQEYCVAAPGMLRHQLKVTNDMVYNWLSRCGVNSPLTEAEVAECTSLREKYLNGEHDFRFSMVPQDHPLAVLNHFQSDKTDYGELFVHCVSHYIFWKTTYSNKVLDALEKSGIIPKRLA